MCHQLRLNVSWLFFPSPLHSGSAETDDYAEIIDEEDTYTMPSSKYTHRHPHAHKHCWQLMWQMETQSDRCLCVFRWEGWWVFKKHVCLCLCKVILLKYIKVTPKTRFTFEKDVITVLLLNWKLKAITFQNNSDRAFSVAFGNVWPHGCHHLTTYRDQQYVI